MKILNLTQHPASSEQRQAGVIDLPPELKRKLAEFLTFEELPRRNEIRLRAEKIADLAYGYIMGQGGWGDAIIGRAMIGGAPYLMAPLRTCY